jgi:ankyrin repeat protein
LSRVQVAATSFPATSLPRPVDVDPCLDYAIRVHNLLAVDLILERPQDSISLESFFEHNDTIKIAIISTRMGYSNVLRAAIKRNSEALSATIDEDLNLTLLHVIIFEINDNIKFGQMLMETGIKVITTLIECGLDVNVTCRYKITALHLASKFDQDVIVNVLLEQGANINLTDDSGQNALRSALQKSKVNMTIIKLLIDKGIDAKAKDQYGRTPLHLCCTEGHCDALIMLLNHEAENRNLLQAIFRRGPHVNVKDFYGRTPLHYTCYRDWKLT